MNEEDLIVSIQQELKLLRKDLFGLLQLMILYMLDACFFGNKLLRKVIQKKI